MFKNKTLVTSLVLITSLLAPAATLANAAESHKAPCVLDGYHTGSVAPYYAKVGAGRATVQRLRGASVFVRAEPGLTAQWLELQVERHLESMRSADMTDCALDVADVRVDVVPAGTGFRVRMIAPDTETGKEVLRRAQHMFG